jgi:DegV family protein with EDD domain
MSKVALVIDSTTFMPPEYMQKYGMRSAPARIIWAGDELKDGIDIQPSEFYTRLQTDSEHPTTTQATPMDFKEIYDGFLGEGRDILVMTISSKFSGMYLSAEQAKGMLPGANIEIIDTLTGSMGTGWPALHVAEAAEKGASLSECKAIAENAINNVGIILVVDTLDYLHKGGRIGGASRFLGSALNLKPILEVTGGAFEGIDRVRTSSKAINRMIELIIERIAGRSPVHLAALHANAPDLAKQVLEQASAQIQPTKTLLADVSPAVGVHLGPGTVGLAFMAGVT